MRGLPFFKPKNKPQFAGLNFSDTSSGGGGGGGGGGGDSKYRNAFHGSVSYQEAETGKVIQTYTVEKDGFYLVSLTFNDENNNVVGYIKHNNTKMAFTPQFVANYGFVNGRTVCIVINASANDTISTCGDVLTYASPTIDTYSIICEL